MTKSLTYYSPNAESITGQSAADNVPPAGSRWRLILNTRTGKVSEKPLQANANLPLLSQAFTSVTAAAWLADQL